MSPDCLKYTLTTAEEKEFNQNGYLILKDALSPEQVKRYVSIVDEIDVNHRQSGELTSNDHLNLHDTIGHDERLLELIDWSTTFPKVWGILGWHIQLYHTQMIITPPSAGQSAIKKTLGWHQDNNRMGKDLETTLHPRISVKVAYFLTDTTRLGNGNLHIVPRSHLQNQLTWPNDGNEPQGAMPLQLKAGTAVIFDRRLWHAGSPNPLDTPRKVLFYGYSYRWLRPKCAMNVAHLLDKITPIRRQLLGVTTDNNGYFNPQEENVPLRTWLREHIGKEAVDPWEHTPEERRGMKPAHP